MCMYTYTGLGCPWCNGYRHRKWTRRYEFKSWTRLLAFHIALIPFGKVWIQLFSLQLGVNSWADWVLQPWLGNESRRKKTQNLKPVKLRLKIDLVSYPPRAEGFINIYTYTDMFIYTYTHVYIHIYTHVYVHICTHVFVHIYTRLFTHKQICWYIHIHTWFSKWNIITAECYIQISLLYYYKMSLNKIDDF